VDLFLLNISAFLRPIFFIDIQGSNLFDLAAIAIFCVLAFAFLMTVAMRRRMAITSIDFMIIAFAVWSICIYFIYFEKAHIRNTAQFLIPLFTYIVAKNVLTGPAQYIRLLKIMILGFTIPLILSVGMIALGSGMDYVDYWTGVKRWRGAYDGAHGFGHNMGLLIILICVYLTLVKRHEVEDVGNPGRKGQTWFFIGIAGVALICLALSQVRTVIIGIALFLFGFGWYFHRKALYVGLSIFTVTMVALAPIVLPILFQDFYRAMEGEADASYIASGRPEIWENVVETFTGLPIDEKIAGMGIGNKTVRFASGVYDAHNDWLQLLLETGIVGFLLYASIHVLMFRVILRINNIERYLFLVFLLVVEIMNLGSNSYITRFGIAQMFYMLMAYIEIERRQAADVQSPLIIR
jgi:O-antigen ligase